MHSNKIHKLYIVENDKLEFSESEFEIKVKDFHSVYHDEEENEIVFDFYTTLKNCRFEACDEWHSNKYGVNLNDGLEHINFQTEVIKSIQSKISDFRADILPYLNQVGLDTEITSLLNQINNAPKDSIYMYLDTEVKTYFSRLKVCIDRDFYNSFHRLYEITSRIDTAITFHFGNSIKKILSRTLDWYSNDPNTYVPRENGWE